MKLVRSSLGCVAAGVALLAAGTAGAIAITNPTNSSALSFGSIFAYEVGQWVGSDKDDQKSGVDGQVVEVYAGEGQARIYVQGAALNPWGDGGGVVALVWYLQTPNQVKRKEDKMKVDQDTDVSFALRLYTSQANFEDFEPECGTAFVLLDSCEGSAKVKDKDALQGKFEVSCKDVSASTVATRLLDEEQGNLDCDVADPPSQEALADLISSFLDENGKLDLRVKDNDGVRTNESVVID